MPQPLFPPDYPERPEAPLASFGLSFSEEISRSVLGAIWYENLEKPHEVPIRTAAALTMLEAFHPRDHLECMMAAQGVAAHVRIMDLHRLSMHPDTSVATLIKLSGSITQMSRTFTMVLVNLDRRQSKPLPQRPLSPPPASPPGSPPAPPPGAPAAASVAEPIARHSDPLDPTPEHSGESESTPTDTAEESDTPELPGDFEIRPDGTPGNLIAYAPKPPKEVYVPKEAAINKALATRPSLWRIVNKPKDQQPEAPPPVAASSVVVFPGQPLRGPLDLKEDIFHGDALSRFASKRMDPDAPVEPPNFDHEDASIELELISTGGDPELEERRRQMMAEHPEGKPITTIHYGPKPPEDDTPPDA